MVVHLKPEPLRTRGQAPGQNPWDETTGKQSREIKAWLSGIAATTRIIGES